MTSLLYERMRELQELDEVIRKNPWPLSIAMAVGTTRKRRAYQLSEESIMVG